MFRATCLAMFWRHCGGTSWTKHFTVKKAPLNATKQLVASMRKKQWLAFSSLHSVTFPATAKIVARQVARKVEPNSTFSNGSCNLSRNDFGRCRVCYTVKCFVQLVPPQCRENIARQVARNISQCNSASTFLGVTPTGKQKTESLKTEHTTNFNIPFNQ